ncbi:PAQR family membrane homeostasis protein TrhA [Actinomadura rupiterrae]|uniref:PAQR family membrane homeostasis protein TrhA n=1 Tax=Actinomadura rupiterrae TaxID=559627 RepID=UPI0020A3653E|nr:hemolysin III family protein [Actinomadura rupiterrae]MCP2342681.1 hemolysin III [Actinomadura rupiterrae]
MRRAAEIAGAVKPKLRGWLHAGTFPLALLAGIALVALGPTLPARICAAVYTLTSTLLFGVSAAYHRGRWSTRVQDVLRRFDHANIYLIIAGTYTPFAYLILHGAVRVLVLSVVWAGALAGVLFRVLWVRAPRWLYTALYIGLGWVAAFFVPQFIEGTGVAVALLVALGGVLYSVGGLVYGLRRPDPSPRWFGFHEVFHAFTVAAYVLQYIAVSFVVYRAGTA